MMDLRLENILLDIFQEDINNNKAQTYITQITILTIKSLIPSVNEIGNRIDYRRFYEELKLWKYYSLGENNSLLNILGDIDEDVYFSLNDSTLYSRIIPIILDNENHDIIEDEIIKKLYIQQEYTKFIRMGNNRKTLIFSNRKRRGYN